MTNPNTETLEAKKKIRYFEGFGSFWNLEMEIS